MCMYDVLPQESSQVEGICNWDDSLSNRSHTPALEPASFQSFYQSSHRSRKLLILPHLKHHYPPLKQHRRNLPQHKWFHCDWLQCDSYDWWPSASVNPLPDALCLQHPPEYKLRRLSLCLLSLRHRNIAREILNGTSSSVKTASMCRHVPEYL